MGFRHGCVFRRGHGHRLPLAHGIGLMGANSRREALEKLASAEVRLRRALVLLYEWAGGGNPVADTDQFLFEEETIWAGEGYTKKRLYEGGE